MAREIKFRGNRLDNGEQVEGDRVDLCGRIFIGKYSGGEGVYGAGCSGCNSGMSAVDMLNCLGFKEVVTSCADANYEKGRDRTDGQ